MVNLVCHNVKQEAVLYHIKPTKKGYEYDVVYHLEKCQVCGNPALLLRHVDYSGNKTTSFRLKPKNILWFVSRMKIIYKEKKYDFPIGTNKPYYYYWAVEGNVQIEKTLDDYRTGRELCTIPYKIESKG